MKNRDEVAVLTNLGGRRYGTLIIVTMLCGIGCSSNAGTEIAAQSSEALGGAHCTKPVEIGKSGLYLKTTILLPHLAAGSKFSYDIGAVDARAHRYFLADRTNKSLDIIDTRSYAIKQVPGFAGAGASNDVSGPDGVVLTPHGIAYVGDVDNVKVVDANAGTILATIPVATTGFRTDEGCYDPDDEIVMFQNPADSPPFATFISADTNTIVAHLPFPGASGLEACVYDARTRSFFVNNDGTTANPNGEVDVITAKSVRAGSPSVSARYALGSCGPTGIDLNRRHELVIGCDAPAGDPQLTLLLNAGNGAIRHTITNVGGSDEVAFDSHLDRFYVAARDMTASGISQTGVTGAKFTPVLGIIDARSGKYIDSIPTGSGSHSVATDAETGDVFVPVPPTATAAGGVQVYSPVCRDDDERDDDEASGAMKLCRCERRFEEGEVGEGER